MCSRILNFNYGVVVGRSKITSISFNKFRGGLYPAVRLMSSKAKNKNAYINHEMYRRIVENKAKFPVQRKIKIIPKAIYKSKVEFGPWYVQQLQQNCLVIAVGYFFWPGIPKSVCTIAATIAELF